MLIVCNIWFVKASGWRRELSFELGRGMAPARRACRDHSPAPIFPINLPSGLGTS